MSVDRNQLKRRARSCIEARIPDSVRNGSANTAVRYRDAAAVCAGFVQRGGVQLGRIVQAVETLERFQGLR